MDWIVVLLPVLLPMLLECFNADGEEKVLKRLENPGPRVQWAIRRGLRQEGLRGKELRQATQEAVTDLREATRSELIGLIREAQETD
jgi:hypothetical protein